MRTKAGSKIQNKMSDAAWAFGITIGAGMVSGAPYHSILFDFFLQFLTGLLVLFTGPLFDHFLKSLKTKVKP